MHVLRMHAYRRPGEEEGAPFQDSSDRPTEEVEDDNERETIVFEKYDKHLFGQADGTRKELLSIAFVKKYIHYAKNRIVPKLSVEASELIASYYAELRNVEDVNSTVSKGIHQVHSTV